ncbi:riboflavin synthase [Paenibacillus thermoaerophilus]|uniref:Riboflavin synthase n=1 Tax=Paenibacillus thermoaerophilus TaxID=1215385 RepID=A0ABW2V5U0_9BACL|nr:riboflavin synthase [Paenibacillus thermoaerophilus]TMV07496.1 riboflavin synthase [Paenibacillus thermoaerophilus]
MFTGLVEEVGTLRAVSRQGEAMVLTLNARLVLEDVSLGDSISVNGVCLTVVGYDASSFTVDVMPETYRQTNLSKLTPGSPVNLERAMKADKRFGGHIVQGHVDAVGTIVSRTPEANAVVFELRVEPKSAMRYIVDRGSVTLDGISLTVVRAGEDTFTVSIIPHTLAQTALRYKKPGDTVNIETDILGRYIEKLLAYRSDGGLPGGRDAGKGSRLTAEFLAEHGF